MFEQGVLAREQADDGTQTKDAAALDVQAWELLQGIVAVIERRKAAGTTVRKDIVTSRETVASHAWFGLVHP